MAREVSEERAKEINKQKVALRKELENVEVSDFVNEANMSDRDYAREFKKIYVGVRKGLVLIQKKKQVGLLSNEECVSESKKLLELFL